MKVKEEAGLPWETAHLHLRGSHLPLCSRNDDKAQRSLRTNPVSDGCPPLHDREDMFSYFLLLPQRESFGRQGHCPLSSLHSQTGTQTQQIGKLGVHVSGHVAPLCPHRLFWESSVHTEGTFCFVVTWVVSARNSEDYLTAAHSSMPSILSRGFDVPSCDSFSNGLECGEGSGLHCAVFPGRLSSEHHDSYCREGAAAPGLNFSAWITQKSGKTVT